MNISNQRAMHPVRELAICLQELHADVKQFLGHFLALQSGGSVEPSRSSTDLAQHLDRCDHAINLAVGIGHYLDYGMEQPGWFESHLRQCLASLRTALGEWMRGADTYKTILACAMIPQYADPLSNVALRDEKPVGKPHNGTVSRPPSLNARALHLISRAPEMANESAKEWAARLDCSEQGVRNLQAWKFKQRGRGSAASKKVMELCMVPEPSAGARESVLEQLIAEQEEDAETDMGARRVRRSV